MPEQACQRSMTQDFLLSRQLPCQYRCCLHAQTIDERLEAAMSALAAAEEQLRAVEHDTAQRTQQRQDSLSRCITMSLLQSLLSLAHTKSRPAKGGWEGVGACGLCDKYQALQQRRLLVSLPHLKCQAPGYYLLAASTISRTTFGSIMTSGGSEHSCAVTGCRFWVADNFTDPVLPCRPAVRCAAQSSESSKVDGLQG